MAENLKGIENKYKLTRNIIAYVKEFILFVGLDRRLDQDQVQVQVQVQVQDQVQGIAKYYLTLELEPEL